MTDEQLGRAWAKQMGKRPVRYGSAWYWLQGISYVDPPAAAVHRWLWEQLPERSNPFIEYGTEADAYAALGRALRAVWAAVPPLESPS